MSMQKSALRLGLVQLEFCRRKYLRSYFVGLGLPLGQGQPRILTRLLEADGCSQRELAEACAVDAATLSRALDRLEQAGLVERAASPESRRSVQVLLTPQGCEKAREIQRGFDTEDEIIWQGFTEAEMQTLLAGMARIRKNLEQANSYEPGEKQ